MTSFARNLACAVALGLALAPVPALAAPAVSRIEGANRYETMAAISRLETEGGSRAILVTGESFPDALSASALGGAKSCPIILTKSDSLTPEANTELERLGVSEVLIVGGPEAVSDGTQSLLESKGINTTRIADTNRLLTSVATFEAVRAADSSSDTVIIATGSSFADALSMSPWAYATSSPIVLADASGLIPPEAADAIKSDMGIGRVVLVGGYDVVSEANRTLLGTDYTYVRLAGSNRYDTSRAVAEWETGDGDFTWTTPVLATGKNFPDALAGSALCGRVRAPLLLANGAGDATMLALTKHQAQETEIFMLGGASSIDVPLDQLFATTETMRSLMATYGEGVEALRRAYEFVSGFEYVTQNLYPAGDWSTWSIGYANEMLNSGGGNCYRYASLLCWMARTLGFDARVVSGNVMGSSGALSAHGWVEVNEGGQVYVCDADMHKFVIGRDFFMQTYDSAPLQYYDLNGLPY